MLLLGDALESYPAGAVIQREHKVPGGLHCLRSRRAVQDPRHSSIPAAHKPLQRLRDRWS